MYSLVLQYPSIEIVVTQYINLFAEGFLYQYVQGVYI